ncbi:pseudouridylate synthase, partial [Cystoisospora suis]
MASPAVTSTPPLTNSPVSSCSSPPPSPCGMSSLLPQCSLCEGLDFCWLEKQPHVLPMLSELFFGPSLFSATSSYEDHHSSLKSLNCFDNSGLSGCTYTPDSPLLHVVRSLLTAVSIPTTDRCFEREGEKEAESSCQSLNAKPCRSLHKETIPRREGEIPSRKTSSTTPAIVDASTSHVDAHHESTPACNGGNQETSLPDSLTCETQTQYNKDILSSDETETEKHDGDQSREKEKEGEEKEKEKEEEDIPFFRKLLHIAWRLSRDRSFILLAKRTVYQNLFHLHRKQLISSSSLHPIRSKALPSSSSSLSSSLSLNGDSQLKKARSTSSLSHHVLSPSPSIDRKDRQHEESEKKGLHFLSSSLSSPQEEDTPATLEDNPQCVMSIKIHLLLALSSYSLLHPHIRPFLPLPSSSSSSSVSEREKEGGNAMPNGTGASMSRMRRRSLSMKESEMPSESFFSSCACFSRRRDFFLGNSLEDDLTWGLQVDCYLSESSPARCTYTGNHDERKKKKNPTADERDREEKGSSTISSSFEMPQTEKKKAEEKQSNGCEKWMIEDLHALRRIVVIGRYIKNSRELSQSLWIVNNKRKLEMSVEEAVATPLKMIFAAKESRFISAG